MNTNEEPMFDNDKSLSPIPFLNKMNAIVLTGAAIMACAGATADALSEEDFFLMTPVVLSASRLSQPIDEAPAAVTVINRQMIKASGARNIPDLFRLVPGFVVGQANNFRAATSQHGISSSMSRRMQVLVDGRSVTSPVFGGVQWYDLPLAIDDIDRIEVVRGPNASSYGASALLGVINIITRHAAQDQGSRATLHGGANNVADGYLSHSDQTGKLDWRVSLQYRQDDGMTSQQDDYSTHMAMLRGDYQLDNHNELLIQGGISRTPRDVDSPNPSVPVRTQQAESYYGQLRLDHDAGGDHHFWLQAYSSTYDARQPFSFVFSGLPGQPADDTPLDITARRSDIEFEDNWQLGERFRFVWGGGIRRDEVRSALAFGSDKPMNTDYQRVFSNAEWRLAQDWTLNAGGIYEHYDFTGSAFSPRLALNYRISPQHVLRLAGARATRVPVIYEEMANLTFSVDTPGGVVVNEAYVSSGDLSAETIDSLEIGYLGHYLHGRLDVDARLYHESLQHLIAQTLQPASDYNGFVYDFSDVDHARVSGAELQIDYRLSDSHFYRLAYGYTHVASDDMTQPLSDSAPAHVLGLLGAFPLPHGLKGSAAYYFNSGLTYLTDFDGGLGGDALDPMHRLDLRVAYPFRYARSDNEVALVIQNALGDSHEFQEETAVPRSLWLELRANLPVL